MHKYLFLVLIFSIVVQGISQNVDSQNQSQSGEAQKRAQASLAFSAYFQEAYQKYPKVPKGLLEAVAYTNTRMQNIQPDAHEAHEHDFPVFYSVMGLVEDGKGYFRNTLILVAEKSGYPIDQIKKDPKTSILAYAKAYEKIMDEVPGVSSNINSHGQVLARLSEIPTDNTIHNLFAQDQQFYAILCEMEKPHLSMPGRAAVSSINFRRIFGKENYRVLSASRVVLSSTNIRNSSGDRFTVENGNSCTNGNGVTDYPGALWVPAHENNYGSRGGTQPSMIAIHTIQGSYASAISWFKNRNARVAAHYIIRAIDGQITQMVCEEDAGYHVRGRNSTGTTYNALSIGIEHEGFIDEGAAWYTQEMYNSSAELVKDICRRKGINPLQMYGGRRPIENTKLGDKCYKIKGHKHFRENTHIDPGPEWDWEKYYQLINPAPTPILFSDKRGTITDPGGNDNYGDQLRITYIINPPGAETIHLKFKELDLEGTKEVPYDFLDIYDGKDATGALLGRFTGDSIPDILTAKSGTVFMEFRTDCADNKKGWKLTYSINKEEVECPPPFNLIANRVSAVEADFGWELPPQASSTQVFLEQANIDGGILAFKPEGNQLNVTGLAANNRYLWKIRSVCPTENSVFVSDEITTPDIGTKGKPGLYTIKQNTGTFHDSGGPSKGYINNESYIYRIHPPNGKRIQLTFTELDIEENFDKLIVYDGPGNNAPVLATLTGTNDNQFTVASTGEYLTMQFTSDGRTTGSGWKARWKTLGAADPTGPDPTSPNTPFGPVLTYEESSPETRPVLEEEYTTDFTLQFDDIDKGGRGFASRYYNIAENTGTRWKANSDKGFIFEDFNKDLANWNLESGTWKTQSGQLFQLDTESDNTNAYTPLQQVRNEEYLYHWQARMTGDSENKRHGLHFFADAPQAVNRGNSYFIWIRTSKNEAFAELYKTSNGKFNRRKKEKIDLEEGKIYDYKTFFSPSKGRIELYVNNERVLAFNDASPLEKGNSISLRTGNCVLTLDNLIVYKLRNKSVALKLGPEPSNDIRFPSPENEDPAFRITSLVMDKLKRWSRPGVEGSVVYFDDVPGDSGPPTPGPDPISEPDDENPPTDPTLPPPTRGNTFNDDFNFPLSSTDNYFLVAEYDGNSWASNRDLGMLYDDFSMNATSSPWKITTGEWELREGSLAQSGENFTNGSIYAPLAQQKNQSYLYHFKTKLNTKGKNKRFGLHFYCSSGQQTNRGDSYMVWFRNHDDKQDKVEVYRSDNNNLDIKASADVNIQSGEWYDVKITFNSSTGEIDAYLQDRKVISWKDPEAILSQGRFVSFRTGNSDVEFDELRVYQQSRSQEIRVTVGAGSKDMIRYQTRTDQPSGLILHLNPPANNKFGPVDKQDIFIRP